VDVQIHVSLTSELVGREWLPSRPCHFTPEESVRRVGLDDVEKRKFLTLPVLELRTLGRPARNQSLYRLRYPGITSWRLTGECRYNSTFLKLCRRWRLAISFTLTLLPGNGLSYALCMRLGRPQSRSRLCGEENEIWPLPVTGEKSSVVHPLAKS
jgi:hypothetical protein